MQSTSRTCPVVPGEKAENEGADEDRFVDYLAGLEDERVLVALFLASQLDKLKKNSQSHSYKMQ